jgi:hypothetical protein
MVLQVIFSDEATDTFQSINKQLQVRWGDKEVNEFRRRTYNIIEIISKFPFLFPTVTQSGTVRKSVIHKNCSMFYKVSEHILKYYSFGIIDKILYSDFYIFQYPFKRLRLNAE